MLISIKYQKAQLFSDSDKPIMLFFLLINVKMPTIVGILTFMSRKNSCSVELNMKKSFITSGPGIIIHIIAGWNTVEAVTFRLPLSNAVSLTHTLYVKTHSFDKQVQKESPKRLGQSKYWFHHF